MNKKVKKENTETTNAETEVNETEDFARGRPQRRKTYMKMKDSDIPQELRDLFFKKGYALRWVRWAIQGEPDYRYLHRRGNEDGYEFVTKDEIAPGMLSSMRILDTQVHKGMITNGSDLCLMKVDLDFQNSRREYYNNITDEQVESVDIHTLRKKGFKNAGSKSQTMFREPTFQD